MTISKTLMRDRIREFLWDLDDFWNDSRGQKYSDLCDNIKIALNKLDNALSAEERGSDPDRNRE